MERVGPIQAIKRSGSLLRQTWGEQLAGNFGISLVFGLLALLVLVVGVLATIALAQVSIVLAVVAVVATVLVVGAIVLVGAALSGIYPASLYRYATKGDPGSNFRAETMSSAFRSKAGGARGFGQPR